MKKVHKIIALGVVLALAGCGAQAHQGPYGGHDAHWYTTHSKQMEVEAKWCNAGSVHRGNSKSCNAVNTAMNEIMDKDYFG